ncbi:hypothetical protein OHE95_10120, partial [Escherichia coli]|nr:hypothetical protein [Escherichia coli]
AYSHLPWGAPYYTNAVSQVTPELVK